MRTATKSPRASTPKAGTVCDAAPSLVSRGRKIRAKIVSPEPASPAQVDGLQSHEQAVIDAAMAILRARLRQPGEWANSSTAARSLALLHLGGRDIECFAVMFLDGQNRLIAFEELFRGTLKQTSVYPREVVRSALRNNADNVIFVHNHPSGSREPSRADEVITKALKSALALVDVGTLDHLIVSGDQVSSFAEMGLM